MPMSMKEAAGAREPSDMVARVSVPKFIDAISRSEVPIDGVPGELIVPDPLSWCMCVTDDSGPSTYRVRACVRVQKGRM